MSTTYATYVLVIPLVLLVYGTAVAGPQTDARLVGAVKYNTRENVFVSDRDKVPDERLQIRGHDRLIAVCERRDHRIDALLPDRFMSGRWGNHHRNRAVVTHIIEQRASAAPK